VAGFRELFALAGLASQLLDPLAGFPEVHLLDLAGSVGENGHDVVRDLDEAPFEKEALCPSAGHESELPDAELREKVRVAGQDPDFPVMDGHDHPVHVGVDEGALGRDH